MQQYIKKLRKYPDIKQLLTMEEIFIKDHLPEFTGYFMLQLGNHLSLDYLSTRVIHHASCIVDEPMACHSGVDIIQADYRELPLANESIDLAILPHSLDDINHPDEIIAEVWRALIPGGTMMVFGFNPLSYIGLRHYIPSKLSYQWHSSGKIRRLLMNNNFKLIQFENLFFAPPSASSKWRQRLQPLEITGRFLWPYFGNVYFFLVKKEMTTMTPIVAPWKKEKAAVNGKIAEPSSFKPQNSRSLDNASASSASRGCILKAIYI